MQRHCAVLATISNLKQDRLEFSFSFHLDSHLHTLKQQVRKAAKDRKLAEKYRRESEAAKRKFVAGACCFQHLFKLKLTKASSCVCFFLSAPAHVDPRLLLTWIHGYSGKAYRARNETGGS